MLTGRCEKKVGPKSTLPVQTLLPKLRKIVGELVGGIWQPPPRLQPRHCLVAETGGRAQHNLRSGRATLLDRVNAWTLLLGGPLHLVRQSASHMPSSRRKRVADWLF